MWHKRGMESNLPGTALAPPVPKSRLRGWVGLGYVVAIIIVVLIGAEAFRVMFGNNFHVVIPGEFYRCSQVTGVDVERLVRERGMRTLLNLRGRGDGMDWYDGEALACQRLGISHECLTFSASRLPSRTELRQLIQVFDHTPRPIVVHCRQGADRTGLASAVLLLLQSDCSFAEARSKMGLRYGHWRWGPAGELGDFFDLYQTWLEKQSSQHTPALFRRWATEFYDAGICSFEVLGITPMQDEIRAGEHAGLKVKFRNTSGRPWEFHAISRAGVHVTCEVNTDASANVSWSVGGLFEKTVGPGEEVELIVLLRPMPAGRYRMRIDLVNGERGPFVKFGQLPIEQELIVRE